MANLVKPDKVFLDKDLLTENFDKSVLENISWSYRSFRSHREIATGLRNQNPYTVTILIENLNHKLWNKKEYVKKTRVAVPTKYRQLLFEVFFEEYGETGGNEIYGRWLDKYHDVWLKERTGRDLDEYVISGELEPRYKQKILKRFKNHGELFRDRFRIDRKRYYNLPEPFNYVDWRNSFDNIFIWKDNDGKMAARGGSGSSGGRETNSKFAFGFLEINKKKLVPSYLFLYSGENKLLFVRKFDSLCLPSFDIGSNYHLDSVVEKRVRKGGLFLRWREREGIESIEIHKE